MRPSIQRLSLLVRGVSQQNNSRRGGGREHAQLVMILAIGDS